MTDEPNHKQLCNCVSDGESIQQTATETKQL